MYKRVSLMVMSLLSISILFSCTNTEQGVIPKEYANNAEKLGFAKGSRVLILHADDIGMCKEANTSVIPYLQKGQIQSAAVMMPCDYAEEFMQWYKENPEYDIGLHLTHTSEWKTWRWATVSGKERVPGLLDSEGFMWRSVPEVVQHATAEEVKHEVRAQIEKALALGVRPGHMDTHMGTLSGSNEFTKIYLELAEAYQIPAMVVDLSNPDIAEKFMAMGYPITDDLITMASEYSLPILDDFDSVSGGKSYEEVRSKFYDKVRKLKPGITEIIFHPSVLSDHLKEITNSWQQRVWEAELFSDPEVIQFLKNEEIVFTNWKELMKRNSAKQ